MHTQIRNARKSLSLDQVEFAEACGVAVRTVQSWEAGDRTPRAAALRRVAQITGRPISYFFEEHREGTAA